MRHQRCRLPTSICLLIRFLSKVGVSVPRLRIWQRADKGLASDELPSLLNITLEQVAEGLEGGKFTSVELVKAYIARIEECNEEFRSVLQINPDAVHVAELLDQERGRSGRRG